MIKIVAANKTSMEEDQPPSCPTQRGGKPSVALNTGEIEDEPPSTLVKAANKDRFFADVPAECWNDWQWQFRHRITTLDDLAKYIPFSAEEKARLQKVVETYPISVTPYYLSLIRDPADPADPVRQQAVPCYEEIALAGLGLEDPLEEKRESVVPGLVHRYPDRVLMVLTNICPMFCRHCTRKREWKHGTWVRNDESIEAMLAYIRRTKTVRDVILSGGDPLTLSTRRLESVLSRLRKIPHVEIIRLGSRFPVTLPQRVDDELCAMLSKYGPIWLNTHFNHPNEVTVEAARAVERLLRAGVPVNNQTVLLGGVNDNVPTQLRLSHKLLRSRVRPYYLFQCDEVQGTEHFRTPVETGIGIIEGMRGHTSGLAVPTYVIDLSGGGGKVPLQPNYILAQTKDELILRNYEGRFFSYRNPRGGSPNGGNGHNGDGQVEIAPGVVVTRTRDDEDRALVRR